MRSPDVEAQVYFLATSEGGRSSGAISGYRPGHAVREDYITTGVHDYLDVTEARPGETVRATITFITPEAYPATLWVGKVVPVQEGSHIVGHATVTKIFNDLLRDAG
jgi:elongation factor Tu